MELHQSTSVLFSAKPALVWTTQDANQKSKVLLNDLVATKCRSLFKPFLPSLWLRSGHVQTLYNLFNPFSDADPVIYRRKHLRVSDGGTIGLDFTPSDSVTFNAQPDNPIIVVAHGLTGGSFEAYLRAILNPACKPVQEGGLGYRAIVVNFRGCAGVPVTSPRLYTAGNTDDLHQALMYIRKNYPQAPLIGLGFSLGANVMTKYVSEAGSRSYLKSAVAVACPWDLEANGHSIRRRFLGQHFYSRGMGQNLLNLVKRHEKALKNFPDHPLYQEFSLTISLRMPTIDEFDDCFTRKIGGDAPIFPMNTVDEYYRWASSHREIESIKIPFLAINTRDDPIVTQVPTHLTDNGLIVQVLTSHGGHLGWFTSLTSRWTTKPILEWIEMVADISVDLEPMGQLLCEDSHGFLREKGNMMLAVKEVDGESIIKGHAGDPYYASVALSKCTPLYRSAFIMRLIRMWAFIGFILLII